MSSLSSSRLLLPMPMLMIWLPLDLRRHLPRQSLAVAAAVVDDSVGAGDDSFAFAQAHPYFAFFSLSIFYAGYIIVKYLRVYTIQIISPRFFSFCFVFLRLLLLVATLSRRRVHILHIRRRYILCRCAPCSAHTRQPTHTICLIFLLFL